jgi:trans-aconitate methyltransferase
MKQTWDAELYEARHAFVWHFGESLVELLAPVAGERILDVGCGPGQLTNKIAEHGAAVVGLDSSPDMIGQARQNFPKLHFVLQSATAMEFEDEFDAVFSNATLHWILDARAAARAMFRALRKGGRLLAEFGGIGNVRTIESAVKAVIEHYTDAPVAGRRFYPSVGEYTSLLEAEGFEVRFAHLFDRPTALEGENGMENWITQFSGFQFEPLAPEARKQAMKEVVELVRSKLYRDGQWFADYRRLRIIAVKP